MSISIIIPNYNSSKTLKDCLEAIFKWNNDNYEVILVDDASNDNFLEIVERFPVKIIGLKENRGAAFARNRGSEVAKGEILLFIDSDIVIQKNTLPLILKSFEENKEIAAVTGFFLKEHRNKNLISQYDNLFIHFLYTQLPKYTLTPYTSILAIKKEILKEMGGFDEKIKGATSEDIELGWRLKDKGFKVLLNKELQVEHLKCYSFKKFIKNKFKLAFDWMLMFLRKKGRQENNQVKSNAWWLPINVIITFFVVTGFLGGIIFFPFFFILIISLIILVIFNINFLVFYKKEKGWLFTFCALGLIFIHAFLAGLGMLSALFFHLFNFELRNASKLSF